MVDSYFLAGPNQENGFVFDGKKYIPARIISTVSAQYSINGSLPPGFDSTDTDIRLTCMAFTSMPPTNGTILIGYPESEYLHGVGVVYSSMGCEFTGLDSENKPVYLGSTIRIQLEDGVVSGVPLNEIL